MNRNDKIKIITSILDNNDGQITEYMLDIITSQNIEHTINKNGVFINLSVLSGDILDYIYSVIININTDITTHLLGKETTTNEYNSPVVIGAPGKDNISLQVVDKQLLTLSNHSLTI